MKSIRLTLLIVLLCNAIVLSASENPSTIPQTLLEYQKLKNEALLHLQFIEKEIVKNEQTIQKTEAIMAAASSRSDENAQKANRVAREAFDKASSAKQKNSETLHYYKAYITTLNEKIIALETLNHTPSVTCNCDALRHKYDGFKKAIKDFSKTVQMSTAEYEKSEKELHESIKEEIEAVLDAVLWGMDNYLKVTDTKMKNLENRIKRSQSGLGKVHSQKSLDKAISKIMAAQTHFKNAVMRNLAIEGAVNEKKIYNTYKTLKSSWELSKQEIEKGFAQLRDIDKDPETRELFGEVASALMESTADYEALLRSSSKFFQRFNLILGGLSVLRDIGYASTHFGYSVALLKQFGEVGEENYKAVQSLIEHKKKIELELKQCGCTYAF